MSKKVNVATVDTPPIKVTLNLNPLRSYNFPQKIRDNPFKILATVPTVAKYLSSLIKVWPNAFWYELTKSCINCTDMKIVHNCQNSGRDTVCKAVNPLSSSALLFCSSSFLLVFNSNASLCSSFSGNLIRSNPMEKKNIWKEYFQIFSNQSLD